MGTLYLVRHGQASFGADNYDQLSELGRRQSERLGAWLAAKGLTFEAAWCGSLQRQRQTLAGICQGAGMSPPGDGMAGAERIRQRGRDRHRTSAAPWTNPIPRRNTGTISGCCATA